VKDATYKLFSIYQNVLHTAQFASVLQLNEYMHIKRDIRCIDPPHVDCEVLTSYREQVPAVMTACNVHHLGTTSVANTQNGMKTFNKQTLLICLQVATQVVSTLWVIKMSAFYYWNNFVFRQLSFRSVWSDGRLFHTVGSETEKVHHPSLMTYIIKDTATVSDSRPGGRWPEPAPGGVRISKRK